MRFLRDAAAIFMGLAMVAASFAQSSTQSEQKKTDADQQAQAAKPQTEQTAKAGETKGESSGANTAVKVHGYWVIDVLNPDKTLVSHHEFENALTTGGAGVLVGLAQGFDEIGGWAVVLNPNASFASTTNALYIEMANVSAPFNNDLSLPSTCNASTLCSPSLTASNSSGLVLAGMVTAGNAGGSIQGVATEAEYCTSSGVSAQTCSTITGQTALGSPKTGIAFTEAVAPTAFTAIPFAAGQIVQVTVTISFM